MFICGWMDSSLRMFLTNYKMFFFISIYFPKCFFMASATDLPSEDAEVIKNEKFYSRKSSFRKRLT